MSWILANDVIQWLYQLLGQTGVTSLPEELAMQTDPADKSRIWKDSICCARLSTCWNNDHIVTLVSLVPASKSRKKPQRSCPLTRHPSQTICLSVAPPQGGCARTGQCLCTAAVKTDFTLTRPYCHALYNAAGIPSGAAADWVAGLQTFHAGESRAGWSALMRQERATAEARQRSHPHLCGSVPSSSGVNLQSDWRPVAWRSCRAGGALFLAHDLCRSQHRYMSFPKIKVKGLSCS